MGYYCNICKQTISDNVYEYSMNHFDRALCITHQRTIKPQERLCSLCKQKISEKVYDYSMRCFGKPLCWEHQKNSSRVKAKTSKLVTQNKILRSCADCKRAITLAVFEFSMQKFGMPLCRNCQPYTERRKRIRGNSVSPKRQLKKPSPIEFGGKRPKDKKYYMGY